jgi:hypothetical protein
VRSSKNDFYGRKEKSETVDMRSAVSFGNDAIPA